MWIKIKTWMIESFVSARNHFTDLVRMIFEHGHILIDKILKLIEQILESPKKTLWIALASLIVFDVALSGKMGVLNYILNFFILILDIIKNHFEAGILFCATTIIIVALIKKVEK